MPPPGAGPGPGGPAGLAPQTRQVIEGIASNTGTSPELVLRFLSFLLERLGPHGDQAVADFLHLPADRQRMALLTWQQTQGGGPQGPPGAPPMPPPGMAGPPGGGPPPPHPSFGPGGPPLQMQGGPPPVMGPGGPGGPMGPPPGMPPPPPPPPPKPPAPKPVAQAPEPKVIPWRPPDADKVARRSPWKDRPFDWDEVLDFAARAERYWEPRQRMIAEQQRIIYRRPVFEAADGTPLNPAEGEVLFLRSKPARDFERYVSLAEPTAERVRRQMTPRVRTEAVEDATQLVENALRDQWLRHTQAWGERPSLGDPQPELPYKIMYLLAAQGGIGWCYEWNDGPDQERHPYKLIPIPWSELFTVGGLVTLRITRMTLMEARGAEPKIAERYPKRTGKDRPNDYPADDAMVKLIGCGDVWGQWWGLAWDFEGGPRQGKKDRGRARWLVEPQPIGQGFPYYRILLPRATGAPALDDDREERIRHTARGVLADRLGDVRMQDQMTSAMATGAIKAIDPPVTLYLSPDREKDENGVLVPPDVNRGIGGKTYLVAGPTREVLEESQSAFTASRDVGNLLGMLGSDDNDASPAVLAGRDSAPSGFARALGSEAAAALYVDPLQRAAMTLIQMVDADTCVLLHRALAGKDPLLTGLAVTGNNGEVELTAKHLELAGNETTITYRDTNMATRLQLADLFMRMVQAEIVPKSIARDELGFEEPEILEKEILREQALQLPPFREALIEREIADTEDAPLIGMFQRALDRVQQQGAPPGQPGMPSPPGGPPPGAVPMPGGTATPNQIMGG